MARVLGERQRALPTLRQLPWSCDPGATNGSLLCPVVSIYPRIKQSGRHRARDIGLGISSKLRRNLARHIMNSWCEAGATLRGPGGWRGRRPSLHFLLMAVQRGAKFGGAWRRQRPRAERLARDKGAGPGLGQRKRRAWQASYVLANVVQILLLNTISLKLLVYQNGLETMAFAFERHASPLCENAVPAAVGKVEQKAERHPNDEPFPGRRQGALIATTGRTRCQLGVSRGRGASGRCAGRRAGSAGAR